ELFASAAPTPATPPVASGDESPASRAAAPAPAPSWNFGAERTVSAESSPAPDPFTGGLTLPQSEPESSPEASHEVEEVLPSLDTRRVPDPLDFPGAPAPQE